MSTDLYKAQTLIGRTKFTDRQLLTFPLTYLKKGRDCGLKSPMVQKKLWSGDETTAVPHVTLPLLWGPPSHCPSVFSSPRYVCAVFPCSLPPPLVLSRTFFCDGPGSFLCAVSCRLPSTWCTYLDPWRFSFLLTRYSRILVFWFGLLCSLLQVPGPCPCSLVVLL